MKKLILIIMCLFQVGCSSYNKTVESAEVVISESLIFEEEDILNAIAVVKEYMKELPDFVIVEKIKYEEDDFVKAWASTKKDTIIIYADYYTKDHQQVQTGIQPNHQYKDWKYILSKDSHGNWNIDDQGYG